MAAVARLMQYIKPSRYCLELDVDLDKFRFTARQTIDFEHNHASRTLVMHAVSLTISSAQLKDGPTAHISAQVQDQTVTFTFAEAIPAGHHALELVFSGEIGPGLHGFYRSQYTQDDQTKWLATTQFEAVHAREAFVCIDEPAAKAVFELSLTIPAHLTAVSNAPAQHETSTSPGRKTIHFNPTPSMSTYLVAYIIGELEYIENTAADGTRVRVYATPGKTNQLAFALDTAIRALDYYNDYFGLPYPLAKLDMIAVPDFAAGAMENWGAVTYRETALLLDPARTSLNQKQRVTEVIAHELAHQWFGNLVTMAWWNDLWLNEGFASWVEVLAQDHLFPEWNVWTQFAGDHFARALTSDGLANTHAIEVEVEDPRAIDEIFDAVSYSKGASIINMLHHYLGAADFKRGLQHYLKQYQYNNATTQQLWESLGKTSGKPVAEVMAAWTSQPGYPVLRFESGQVAQRRFYASPREADQGVPVNTWPIPLSIITAPGHATVPVLMHKPSAKLPENVMTADWFKPNAGQTGFYRVHYTPAMIASLARPLTDQTLTAIDRSGIVSDVFATTQAGLTPSSVALKLLETLRQEPDFVVWSRLADGLATMLNILEDQSLRQQYEQFGRWLNEPAHRRLGWAAHSDEPIFDTLMRPLVLQQALRFDDPASIQEARRQFNSYLASGVINADLRTAIYFGVARHGDEHDFETLLKLYRKEEAPQVKLSLLTSLGRFRQPQLVQRSLELSLSADVRPQDTIYLIAYNLLNRDGRELTWQFIRDQWPTFMERYGAGGHMLESFPRYIGLAFASHAKAAQVREFFALQTHPALTRPVAQAVESIELKADWANRDEKDIKMFLAEWAKRSKNASHQ